MITTVETITAMLTAVPPIKGRPNYSNLTNARYLIVSILKKMRHPDYLDDGHAGVAMSKRTQLPKRMSISKSSNDCKKYN